MIRFTVCACLLAITVALLQGWPGVTNALMPAAQAGQGGCKFYRWQGMGQAEAELSQLFATGATIVHFWIESSSMPYQALVCQR